MADMLTLVKVSDGCRAELPLTRTYELKNLNLNIEKVEEDRVKCITYIL